MSWKNVAICASVLLTVWLFAGLVGDLIVWVALGCFVGLRWPWF